jgi:hypothetical protein
LLSFGCRAQRWVQPALTADGDIVINTIASTGGVGTRRLAVTQ